MSPPRNDEGRLTPESPAAGESDNNSATNHGKRSAAPRLCRHHTVGRYAHGWRAGFAAGARDALRLAQRQINDPEVWWVLAQLADTYGDGYDLAGGDR